MYCIYTEDSRPGTGRIRFRGTKGVAIQLARTETLTPFGRLRRCDYVAVMPLTRAADLIRSGRRAPCPA